MTKARLTEVFDERGNMLKIVVEDANTGAHLFDALWDPSDEQNEQTRASFRAWVNTMLARKQLVPIN